MNLDELEMKEKLKRYNYTDEEIIQMSRDKKKREEKKLRAAQQSQYQDQIKADAEKNSMRWKFILSSIGIFTLVMIFSGSNDDNQSNHKRYESFSSGKNTPPITRSKTFEQEIKENRIQAAKELEKLDTAIRNNVNVRKEALKKASIEHRRINTGGSLMADAYTMPDGRLIICTTKVLAAGPAIMECDGKI